jgi:hypothetical protein
LVRRGRGVQVEQTSFLSSSWKELIPPPKRINA